MRAFVKTFKTDIERGRCWRPLSEDKEINIRDMENIWEGRNRRIAELKARQAARDAGSESAFSSGIGPSTPLQGIDGVDDAARNMMSLSLYRAAMEKDVDVFISALEQISDEKGLTFDRVLDQVSPTGNTYLHLAASVDNGEIVRLIAQHSPALITRKNFNCDTALHLAARAGHWCPVKTLLKFCKDIVHLPSVEGENEQQVDGKHFLLRITNKKGNTALHEALMNFHSQIASCLIEQDPESAFYLNNEDESPLTIAAKADTACVSLILSFREELGKMIEQVKDEKSPIHAAIDSENTDALELISSEAPGFMHFTDGEGRFPLHFAASRGRIREVGYILDKFAASAIQRDKNGILPVHWASIMGEVRVLDKLLEHCPHPRELLDPKGRNILHFAAESGKHEVLRYILKHPTFEELINMKDEQGNTPLHCAAMHFRPRFIIYLIRWGTKGRVKITNDLGMTALDAAVKGSVSITNDLGMTAPDAAAVTDNLKKENISLLRKRATLIALGTGGVQPTYRDEFDRYREALFKEYLSDTTVANLLLMSSIVATVTFAAAFTTPGDSDPGQGMATTRRDSSFQGFIFFDTVALYSSITAAIILLLAQLGNMNKFFFIQGILFLLVALYATSLAFLAGVSLVVSKFKVLKSVIWLIGSAAAALKLFLLILCFCLANAAFFVPPRCFRNAVYYPALVLALYIFGVDRRGRILPQCSLLSRPRSYFWR